jgi:hypothetical protein
MGSDYRAWREGERGRRDTMARSTKKPLPHDPYWDVVQSLMPNILSIYAQYREKKPVILFDMQEHRELPASQLDMPNVIRSR